MRTTNILRHLTWGVLGLITQQVFSQATVPNNGGLAGAFLGWNAGANQILDVRNDANQPIDWYTNATHRMRLWENQTNTINSLTNINQNGFVGISDQPLFFNSSVGAFSRVHLVDRGTGTTNFGYYAQQLGYRRWQRNGVTFTGNSDHGYVGQKYQLDGDNAPVYDKSDMVLHWSNDVQGEDGPDRLRFLFTSNRDGVSAHGSASEEGLEAMRFTHIDNATINAGLGDFYRGNILDPVNVNEPTERLDILNGRLRIRELPTTSSNDGVSKYMVVDNTGVVHWRNLPAAATPGCEWYSVPGGTANWVLSGTANPSGGSCPDKAWRYGIGTTTPSYKFDVQHKDNDRLNNGGINSSYIVNQPGTYAYGMNTTVSGSYYALGYGLKATVSGAGYAVGVEGGVSVNTASIVNGQASGLWGRSNHTAGSLSAGYGSRNEVQTNSTATNVYGSYGNSYGYGSSNVGDMHGAYGGTQVYAGTAIRAYGVRGVSFATLTSSPPGLITNNYGLHGHAYNGVYNYSIYGKLPTGGTINWSGFFEGDISASGVSFPSDMNLKTEIQDLEDPISMLMQLHPKSYSYRREEFPQMGLP